MKKRKLNHDRWEAEQTRKRHERLVSGRGSSPIFVALATEFHGGAMGKRITKGEANRQAIAESWATE